MPYICSIFFKTSKYALTSGEFQLSYPPYIPRPLLHNSRSPRSRQLSPTHGHTNQTQQLIGLSPILRKLFPAEMTSLIALSVEAGVSIDLEL